MVSPADLHVLIFKLNEILVDFTPCLLVAENKIHGTRSGRILIIREIGWRLEMGLVRLSNDYQLSLQDLWVWLNLIMHSSNVMWHSQRSTPD